MNSLFIKQCGGMLKRRLRTLVTVFCLLFMSSNLILFKLVSLDSNHTKQVTYIPFLKKNIDQPTDSCHSAFEFRFNESRRSSLIQHPECKNEDWIRITVHGVLLYNMRYLRSQKIEIKQCEYQSVKWKSDDFSYELGPLKPIEEGSKIDMNEEFFHVRCSSTDLWPKSYSGAFARLFNQSNKLNKTKKKQSSNSEPINLFLLGLDSVSLETWTLNLPRSTDFLIDEMKANVISRYNIVGDGTPANLIPLLTGSFEEKLPNTLKNTKNSSFVDEAYPMIWNDFANHLGYATMYGEDWPSIGTFQYRMKGFSKPPTLHYMRPFHLSAENLITKSPPCSNGRTNFQLNIDYIKDFMRVYRKKGFFGFLFLNEYSHDSNDPLKWIDSEMNDFLNQFYTENSISDNTILILFSDHGARFSENRKSIKGLLQERNPFLSIYLPKLFRERYPAETAHLLENSNNLVSPADLHQTFMHLISLESGQNTQIKPKKESSSSSLSLFSPISNKRTCSQANIDSHWCACMQRSELEVDAKLVVMAQIFVDYLNKDILGNHKAECQLLELENITKVYLLESTIDLSYADKRSKFNFLDIANLNLLKPPPVEQDFQKFLFQIIVKPNNAFFEFTIEYENKLINGNELNEKQIKINKEKISRIDKYGNTSHCIAERFPDLRKYCYCK